MFIVSAEQFRKVIHDLNPDAFDKYDDIYLVAHGGYVFFESLPDSKLSVEIRQPSFRVRLSPKQLRKFYRVLGILEDQPITIAVDSNNWINFNAVI